MIRENFSARANGKLLLTGEYFVLEGAKALALPAQVGQRFQVSPGSGPDGTIAWESLDDEGECWFEGVFRNSENGGFAAEAEAGIIAARIEQLLNASLEIKPGLGSAPALHIRTRLEFPLKWGLGSSSTLVFCLATWLEIDPYELLQRTFGGSGYDLACAAAAGPLIYRIQDSIPQAEPIDLNWPFKDNLYFVYLESKQDSRESIRHFRENYSGDMRPTVEVIGDLTRKICSAATLETFCAGIEEHEFLLSAALAMPAVKERLFPDFKGCVKSLGGWGGDFALAASSEPWHDVVAYFTDQGYPTVIAWKNLILEKAAASE